MKNLIFKTVFFVSIFSLTSCATEKSIELSDENNTPNFYNTYYITFKDGYNQMIKYPYDLNIMNMFDSTEINNIQKIDTVVYKSIEY